MTSSTYLIYLAAVALLVVTPGPTLLMCVSNALHHGPARALASAAGALAASLGIMALSAAGLGALLAASEAAFTVLKVAGACYLVWLGIRTFRGTGALAEAAPAPAGRSLFVQGLLVGASNPKALLFFSAFFPQFIDPAAPVPPQFALLAGTFVATDFLMLVAAAFGVGRIAGWLRQARVVRWIDRVCGGLFALLGTALLFTRRGT
ncbi:MULTISPECIES: LysE family translocator [Ramlibacter]|uniref:LysE family transporter n=1 Tax=Ramlibacter pinisoli TaxID=2682844 RepID=A0A6N8IW94_9BURK|nr:MULTISPECIES: LysE family translocator [Ramlibacter]MBA2961163.1 LysE family translocator [Ramlibacter sp. CGMCC 1.13660]MVQ31107.1 LysE family transporter [Ramlibacter pinisoli]